MFPRSDNPAERAAAPSPQEPASEEAIPVESGEADTAVDEVDLECEVCHKTIPAGEEFTVADYGPVHTEPCSHKTRETGDGIPLV